MSAVDLASFREPRRHQPGIVKSIPFAEYLRRPGVNWSSLCHMDTSPLKYRDELRDPAGPTATMQLGSAIHAAVLEPQDFASRYVFYDGVKRGKAWEEFVVEHAEQTALGPEQWEQCMGAAWALHHAGHGREARRVMRGCRREQSLQWTDPETGIRCKARPDLLRITRTGVDVLADVKTTSTVDARKFGRLAADLLYHGKMAFAARGVRAVFGSAPAAVTIVAVEQKRPHDIGVFPLDPDVLLAGDELVGKLLRQLKACRKRRTWPGRFIEPVALDFPQWALPSDTDLTDLGFGFEVRGAQA